MEVKSDKNFELNADIDTVWNVLINPEKVVTCVPGAELTETIDENHLKGKVTIKIGPVTAKFNGDVEIKKENYNNVKDILNKNSVHFDELGEIIEKEMIIDEKTKITINELKESYDLWLRKYMSN